MAEADSLAPNVWNAIVELVEKRRPPREITIGRVVKRDKVKKLIWIDELGETAIPMVDYERVFAYYDTTSTGQVVKKSDPSDVDPAYRTRNLVPKAGELAVVLNMWGNGRFPVCVGIIQSTPGSYWQGEQ